MPKEDGTTLAVGDLWQVSSDDLYLVVNCHTDTYGTAWITSACLRDKFGESDLQCYSWRRDSHGVASIVKRRNQATLT